LEVPKLLQAWDITHCSSMRPATSLALGDRLIFVPKPRHSENLRLLKCAKKKV
jgi:hypothetical protein